MKRIWLLAAVGFLGTTAGCDVFGGSDSVDGVWRNTYQAEFYLSIDLPSMTGLSLLHTAEGDCWRVEDYDLVSQGGGRYNYGYNDFLYVESDTLRLGEYRGGEDSLFGELVRVDVRERELRAERPVCVFDGDTQTYRPGPAV